MPPNKRPASAGPRRRPPSAAAQKSPIMQMDHVPVTSESSDRAAAARPMPRSRPQSAGVRSTNNVASLNPFATRTVWQRKDRPVTLTGVNLPMGVPSHPILSQPPILLQNKKGGSKQASREGSKDTDMRQQQQQQQKKKRPQSAPPTRPPTYSSIPKYKPPKPGQSKEYYVGFRQKLNRLENEKDDLEEKNQTLRARLVRASNSQTVFLEKELLRVRKEMKLTGMSSRALELSNIKQEKKLKHIGGKCQDLKYMLDETTDHLETARTVCIMLQKQNLEMQKNPVIMQLKNTMQERQAKVKDLVESMAEKNREHEADLNQFKTRFGACENAGKELLEGTNNLINKQLVQKMAKKGQKQIQELQDANGKVWAQIETLQKQLKIAQGKCQEMLLAKQDENKKMEKINNHHRKIMADLQENNDKYILDNRELLKELRTLRRDNREIVEAVSEYFVLIRDIEIRNPEDSLRIKDFGERLHELQKDSRTRHRIRDENAPEEEASGYVYPPDDPRAPIPTKKGGIGIVLPGQDIPQHEWPYPREEIVHNFDAAYEDPPCKPPPALTYNV